MLLSSPAETPRSIRLRAGIFLTISSLALTVLHLGDGTLGPVLCPLRRVAGLPCAGCGMTRAFGAMTHGEFSYATQLNPLAIPAGLLFVFVFLAWCKELTQGRAVLGPLWDRPLLRKTATVTLVCALGLGWVVNLHRHFDGRGPLHTEAHHTSAR